MQCPKCKTAMLLDDKLAENLAVKKCPECKGTWIRAQEYETWQNEQSNREVPPDLLKRILDVEYVQSPYDTKAALCPECRRYLSRAKVRLNNPFYVERCSECHGIWCDHGEWEILTQLGLNSTIEKLFSSEWQNQIREQQHAYSEREAVIDKLGEDLAAQVFAIAQTLQDHPQGDFALAYLMRQVSS